MVQDNNIRNRRSGRFSEIITIPANTRKKLNFSNDNYAPFLNYILRNLSDYSLKYYINNTPDDEFEYLDSGEILSEEAQNIRLFELENPNAFDVDVVLTMNNKITKFELDLVSVGEMKYE
jgi:hypothetical protein